jgi:predicted nucleic acid-binding protein
MAAIRTFLDAGVFITAHDSRNIKSRSALDLFESVDRELISTSLLRLEVVPQAAFHKQREEVDFYEACFDCVLVWVEVNQNLILDAERIASKYGLHAMDALYIAAALQAGAQEFITTERVTKPLYRVTELRVVRLESLT